MTFKASIIEKTCRKHVKKGIEQEILNIWLQINYGKTKVMIVDCVNSNHPDLQSISKYSMISEFVYLGSLLSNKGGSKREIRWRSEIAKEAIKILHKIWANTDISKPLIFQILHIGNVDF